jgi:hypothetical protein
MTNFSIAFLFFFAAAANAGAQDLRLEISVPKMKIKASDPVNLTVQIINVSTRSYYVSGDLSLGTSVMGNFGMYHLQLRKGGSSAFVNGPEAALDRAFVRNAPIPSTSDIIVRSKLVLLEGSSFSSMYVGRNPRTRPRLNLDITS